MISLWFMIFPLLIDLIDDFIVAIYVTAVNKVCEFAHLLIARAKYSDLGIVLVAPLLRVWQLLLAGLFSSVALICDCTAASSLYAKLKDYQQVRILTHKVNVCPIEMLLDNLSALRYN